MEMLVWHIFYNPVLSLTELYGLVEPRLYSSPLSRSSFAFRKVTASLNFQPHVVFCPIFLWPSHLSCIFLLALGESEAILPSSCSDTAPVRVSNCTSVEHDATVKHAFSPLFHLIFHHFLLLVSLFPLSFPRQALRLVQQAGFYFGWIKPLASLSLGPSGGKNKLSALCLVVLEASDTDSSTGAWANA